jgi:small nuclear ribonucleoprotein (snRNP)-like protein
MSLHTFINSKNTYLAGPIKRALLLTVGCLEKVLVITADGRTLVGILLSCDQLTNICPERNH